MIFLNVLQELKKEWQAFDRTGLHYHHSIINDMLPNIDELRRIAKLIKQTVIGIFQSNALTGGSLQ